MIYDLVSTSLPNGLLPGTHGFATVAMTRGTPDAVRLALESLSSYKHRHTAHDERYATENPVAWSHLVQRDGSHVLSCVRAADFDYTGRTNRLAHHWCFPRGEFPAGANAAELIAKNTETLSATWSVEARWLEPGAIPAPSSARSDRRATAWIALYGTEQGPSLAAGFASLLRSELQGANRPIVFRTSQTWDVHGTNLLQLFADIIALLPQELRDRATFSTYPAALPDYVTCHLRGLQPDDPKFAALTAGRPWFDCATGEAHGPLPQDPALQYVAQHGHERLEVPRGPKPIGSRAAPGASLPGNGGSQGSTITFQPVPPPGRKAATMPRNNEWLPPPKKDNTTLYYVIGGLVVTVALLAAAVLLRKGPKPPPPSPQSEEQEMVPLSTDPAAASQPNGATNASPESTAVADSAVDASPVEDRRTENVSSAPADTPPEPPPSPKPWSFENAERVVPKPLENANDFHSGFFFYYGGDGCFEQKEAKPGSVQLGGATRKSWGKRPDFSICCILYDEADRTAYFEWKSAEPSRLFANKDSVDLQRLCFGSEPAVFKTWNRLCHAWMYDLKWDNGQGLSGSFRRSANDGNLSAEDAIVIVAQSKLAELDGIIGRCQNALTAATNALATAKQRQSALDTALSKANEFDTKIKGIATKIQENQAKLADEEKKKKKDEAKIGNLKNEIRELQGDREKIIREDVKQFVEQLPQNIKANAGILTTDEPGAIATKMNNYKPSIDEKVQQVNKGVSTAQTELRNAEQDKLDYENQAKGEAGLQSLKFTVRVVITEADQ